MKISPAALYQGYRALVRNPQTRWMVIAGTLLYIFSPLDLSPDIFPIAGQLDDVMLVTLLLTELFQISLFGDGSEPGESIADKPQNSSPGRSGFWNRNPSPGGDSTSKTVSKTVDVDAVSIDD